MRDKFFSYFPPSNAEFEQMWKEGLFALDTNVILNLYRYSASSRDELIEILASNLKERLWLPHQVALEYVRNRPNVILTQETLYEQAKSQIHDLFTKDDKEDLRKKLNIQHHPFINTDDLIHEIDEALKIVVENLDNKMESHPDLLSNDSILETISSLFDGNIGVPYKDDKLDEIYKTGKDRFEKKLPPGYADAEGSKKKENIRKYGDLILWFQIIDKAKEAGKPIIFITNDSSQDWWWEIKGRKIGPRPELRKEMMKKGNVKFYMYNSDRFMHFAQKYLKTKVKQEAIDEIRNIRLEDENRKQIKLIVDQIDSMKRLSEVSHYPSNEMQRLLEQLQPPSEEVRKILRQLEPSSDEVRRMLEQLQPPSEEVRKILGQLEPSSDEVRRMLEQLQPPSEEIRKMLGQLKKPQRSEDEEKDDKATKDGDEQG